jgi:hypothetical protein
MQPAVPDSAGTPARSFVSLSPVVRLLYTHNPFYLLSAGLILYGFHVSFRPAPGELINPWALMAALCSYTLLLAVTAWLIIRLGRVWDDTRSIVLVVLLLLVAVSVSFDEMINTSPGQAYGLILFGLGFALTVSEGLLRGLALRLPGLFRAPLYAVLTLFFVYPLIVSPETTGLSPAAIDFRIFLFPVVAGGTFLTLLPAIRRGARYVGNEHTPWKWPWFPWTAFAFLALGVCLRAYGLSLSFSPARGMESTFGPYFLVPFLFALAVLVLEMGIVERSLRLKTLALVMSPGLLLLAFPGSEGSAPYRAFLGLVVEQIGSPVFFTLGALLLFYTYARLRKVPRSEWAFAGTLLLAVVIDRRTVSLATLATPQWWPLALLAGVEVSLGVARRNSLRTFAGAVCATAALTLGLKETAFMAWGGAIPLHLVLGTALVIGFTFRDLFAFILRRVCAVALPLAVLASATPLAAAAPESVRLAYLLAMTVIAGVCWFFVGDRWFAAAAGISLASVLLAGLSSLQGTWHRQVSSRGFHALVAGALCFMLAALISAIKAGWIRRIVAGPGEPDSPGGSS